MTTKTVDVRLLIPVDVDVELLVEQLVTQTQGAGAPVGAVELLNPNRHPLETSSEVVTRPGVVWHGDAR
jgi:hypothetical protein